MSTVYIPNSYLERNSLLQLEDNYIDYIYKYGISINYPIIPSENELKVVDNFLDDIINKENDMEIIIGYITEFIEIINCYEFEKTIRN